MSASPILIGPGLRLPLETVTQSIAIVAKKRAGKSFTARRLVEQLHRAHQQVVVVDPKGDWWGIRSAADGKAPGLPVVILGGERGDVPLEVGAGEVVAKLVVEERVSALLDLSAFRKHEVHTFMAAFLETLYRLKNREQYRTPMMLVIDEADAIAPQKPMERGNEIRMLGAANDIVRRGGQRGIGCTLITQRTAVLNKDVLTQTQVLVALRTIAPQDLKAMKLWIDQHGTEEQQEELMGVLPSLPIGDAWFWSPGWPDVEGIFQRVHVAPIETFDSGATPKPGERRAEPKQVADVDLGALSRQMAATIERAKADDPKALRARIAQLEREVKAKPAAAAPPAPKVERVEVPVLAPKHLLELQRVCAATESLMERVRAVHDAALNTVHRFSVGPSTPASPQRHAAGPQLARKWMAQAIANGAATAPRSRPVQTSAPAIDGGLGSGERAVLIAIAQHSEGVDRDQVSILTGYKRATRNTYIQRLAARGLIADNGQTIVATDDGVAVLGADFEPLPTGDALREHWLSRLPEGERRVLQVAIEAHPQPIERDAISEATGYKRATRNTYIQRLAARRLIEPAAGGTLVVRAELFG